MHHKKRKIFTLLLAAAMAAGLLAGCGAPPAENPSSQEAPSAPVSAEPAAPAPAPALRNPLNGEPIADKTLLTQRPVAVMINNIKESLPQRGLQAADIIYELPVEGGVTRLMGVYSDYKNLPEIGSVRSARHDYVELALALDAFYVHFGKSPQAQIAFDKTGIDHMDGTVYTNLGFYFDQARRDSGISDLHCWFTDQSHIQAGIDKLGVDMNRTGEAPPAFHFGSDADFAAGGPAGSREAPEVSVPMSGSVTGTFTYDPSSRTYRKGIFGHDQIDELTGKPLMVKNVFVMYTNVRLIDDKHKDADLSAGKGYYISEGRAQPVVFSREDARSMIRVLDENGDDVPVHPGNSWFIVAPNEYYEKIQFSAE